MIFGTIRFGSDWGGQGNFRSVGVNGNRALPASVLSACYNACVQEDLLSQGSTPFNQL